MILCYAFLYVRARLLCSVQWQLFRKIVPLANDDASLSAAQRGRGGGGGSSGGGGDDDANLAAHNAEAKVKVLHTEHKGGEHETRQKIAARGIF